MIANHCDIDKVRNRDGLFNVHCSAIQLRCVGLHPHALHGGDLCSRNCRRTHCLTLTFESSSSPVCAIKRMPGTVGVSAGPWRSLLSLI